MHPAHNVGKVRLETLPEPADKHQPWPANRDLFSPTAGNREGLCACPSLPLEKPTFPCRETPNSHTHTPPLVHAQPRARGPDKKSFVQPPRTPTAGSETRTPEPDPNPGPRARSSKPKRVELPGAGRSRGMTLGGQGIQGTLPGLPCCGWHGQTLSCRARPHAGHSPGDV